MLFSEHMQAADFESTESLFRRPDLFRHLFESLPDGVLIVDSRGRIVGVNAASERLFGYSRDELTGQMVELLVPDRLRAGHSASRESYWQNPRPRPMGTGLELSARRKGGSEFPVEIMLNPVVSEEGRLVLAVVRDITQREQAEEALLLEVTNVLLSSLDIRRLLAAIAAGVRRLTPHDFASLALYDPEKKKMRVQVLASPAGMTVPTGELLLPIEGTPAGLAFSSRQTLVLDRLDPGRFNPPAYQRLVAAGVKSGVWLPLVSRGRALGTLAIGSSKEAAFAHGGLSLLGRMAKQVALAVDNAQAFRQIAELNDRLAEEKQYLEDEVRTEYNFEEIVGESAALKRVLKQVETVAPTDATVLILGETGTGKELIARAIHQLSGRRNRNFVKLSCAAIPAGLLESELFGHERGAFTGAISQKTGRLELAHRGTLFLDEIGDMPLELQPKLLRAIQEREFERVGSTRTIPVDVRLVAATNQDLEHMVKEGRFRGDLYYRLRVFPLLIPPLRQRPEDVPLLANYFAQKHAQRMNKRINTIPPETLHLLSRYSWPGNVRELESLIERAVILSRGPELRVPVTELRGSPQPDSAQSAGSLERAEREHILRVLRETGGVVGGQDGAAARLGLKRTTLNFRMRKLGITREDL